MKGSCPACGARFDLECAVTDADGRRVTAILAEMPGNLGGLTLQYLGLFRPKSGGLRYSRMLTLLEELRPCIRESRVARGGQTHLVPHTFWKEALEHLVTRPTSLRLPLKSNGYLFEILGSMGADLAAKTEREHEAQLRRGQRPKSNPNEPPRTEPQRVSEIVAAMKENMK